MIDFADRFSFTWLRRQLGWRSLLAFAVVWTAGAAQAAVVHGEQAEVDWEPAPGAVTHYGVWITPVGATRAPNPTFTATTNQVTLSAGYGSELSISVAAYYPYGVQGPFSPPSDPIHFVAPEVAPYDFDGNGQPDLLLRGTRDDSRLGMLLAGGALLKEGALPATADTQWRVAGSADFDGDGNADLLMHHLETGTAELWEMEGLTRRSKRTIASLGKQWYSRALGDRDGDAATRVLWHDQGTGSTQLWLMRGARVEAQLPMLPMSGRWAIWATCDVDGNGKRDVVWIDDRAGEARLWLMDSGDTVDEVTLPHPGVEFQLLACGDFGGDGRDEIVWQAGRNVLAWSMSGIEGDRAAGSSHQIRAPRGFKVLAVSDHDGDGDGDLALIDSVQGAVRFDQLAGYEKTSEFSVGVDQSPYFEISSW